MQKLFLIMLLAVFIASCGNQKAEQERAAEHARIEQLRQDSIRLANERAEAERIQKEREEQARLYENKWHGAMDSSELSNRLSGTIWHCYDESRNWEIPTYRLSFDDEYVKIQTVNFREGKGWRSEYKQFPYEVSPSDNIIYVRWGDGSNLDNMRQRVVFEHNANNATYYQESARVGRLIFGDYTWK